MSKLTQTQIWISREFARAWRLNSIRGYRFASVKEAIQTFVELDSDLALVWTRLTGQEQLEVEALLTDTKR